MSDIPNHGTISQRFKSEVEAKRRVCWCINQKRQFTSSYDFDTHEWVVTYIYYRPSVN